MSYPIDLLNEQVKMLSDEYLLAEGVEELLETKERLDECIAAVKLLNLHPVVNCYAEDCLIQDACKSFKTKRCNKECKLYA
jgi:hypothetical protein